MNLEDRVLEEIPNLMKNPKCMMTTMPDPPLGKDIVVVIISITLKDGILGNSE